MLQGGWALPIVKGTLDLLVLKALLSLNNRRARDYRISHEGRRHLETETRALLRYADIRAAILTAPA